MIDVKRMRLDSWLRAGLLVCIALPLGACSYIESLFPDKQKQYRYSSELPDLEIPPDLSASKIEGRETESSSPERRRPLAAQVEKPEARENPKAVSSAPESRPARGRRKPVKHTESSVAMAESSQNTARIEMEEPYDEAWNDVGRALGRLKIEISDQDRSNGVYYVYYGGEPPKKNEETSIWEDITAFFGSEKDKAKEYRVKLDGNGEITHIRILDQNDQAVSEGLGLELLKRLHGKLLTLDQPEPEAEEANRAAESGKK